jgi:hypothetical protein
MSRIVIVILIYHRHKRIDLNRVSSLENIKLRTEFRLFEFDSLLFWVLMSLGNKIY